MKNIEFHNELIKSAYLKNDKDGDLLVLVYGQFKKALLTLLQEGQ